MKRNVRDAGAEWFTTVGSGKVMLAVTLTTDPSKLDFKKYGKSETDRKVKKELNFLQCKLNDFIYGNNWRRKKLNTDIYAVREEKSGHPHIHMTVVVDKPDNVDLVGKHIEHIWKKTKFGGEYNHVDIIHDVVGWVHYCFKHVKDNDTDAIYSFKRVLDF